MTKDIIRLVRDFPGLYLTGSRYFGTDTPQSDWDFFISESEATNLPLHFSEVKGSEYNGDPVVTYILYSEILNCHIQVIPDDLIEKKKRAQEFIYRTSALCGVKDKYHAKAIWRAVLGALIAS